MSNLKKQEKNKRIEDKNPVSKEQLIDIDDVENRLNDLELQMIDAKEFSFLSSEAFEQLQRQITELREMFETLLSLRTTTNEKNYDTPSEYQ